MRSSGLSVGVTLLMALVTSHAAAEPYTGTLKKIRENGVITVGHRDSSVPFSYMADLTGLPVGYSQDIQMRIVESIGQHLQLPALKVRYNLITAQNRIPLVQNGTVDLECGSTTNTEERARQVDFSVGIFAANTRLLSRQDSAYKDFNDLRGKNVVTTAGGTSERLLKVMNASNGMGMNIISGKDIGESWKILETGRAVAFMQDDALLAGERAKARHPQEWALTGTAQSQDLYGCMMRKDDPAFKAVVDDAIKALFSSGEINVIYDKWFNQPIPPKGLNLNFPMSQELKRLITNPTDQPALSKES